MFLWIESKCGSAFLVILKNSRILLKRFKSVPFPALPKAYLVCWNSQDAYNKTKEVSRYPKIPNQSKPTNFKSTKIGFVEKRLDQNQSMLRGDTKKYLYFLCIQKKVLYVAIQIVSVTSLVMWLATHLVNQATSMANFWSSNFRIATDSFGKPSKQTNLEVSSQTKKKHICHICRLQRGWAKNPSKNADIPKNLGKCPTNVPWVASIFWTRCGKTAFGGQMPILFQQFHPKSASNSCYTSVFGAFKIGLSKWGKI